MRKKKLDEDDQINEMIYDDEADEDEEFVNLDTNIGSPHANINSDGIGNNISENKVTYKTINLNNNQRKFRQLVELEEDGNGDETDQEKKINDYEIETINLNKTTTSKNDLAGTKLKISDLGVSSSQPLTKKFKKFDNLDLNIVSLDEASNKPQLVDLNQSNDNYLYTNNAVDLKVGLFNQLNL